MARPLKYKRPKPSNPNAASGNAGEIVPLFRDVERLPRLSQLDPVVVRLREQMALLQGYISMLDSMSPAVQARIFGAIARKTDELVQLLEPYRMRAAVSKPSLEEYRQTRLRTHELLDEYRQLLSRLRIEVSGTAAPESHTGR